ncbi:MAG: HAD hydrolase-like protein, partial [Flavobacteriaceae bacterium]
GIVFDQVIIDKTFPEDNAPTRKPRTGLLNKYMDDKAYDLGQSFVIGDRLTDMELAKNLGAKGLFIANDETLGKAEAGNGIVEAIALKTTSWAEIYSYLKLKQRIVSKKRTTHETEIDLTLNLDGTG